MGQTVFVEEKRELCAAEVTLDGARARISGAGRPFAMVTALPDGPAYEYAWPTVRRIVDQGGAFTSGSKVPPGPYRTVTRATAHRIHGI